MVGSMMPRPLIAHVVNSLATGGLENGVVNLVNATVSRLRHVVICLTTEGVFRSRLDPGVEVFALGKRPGHDLRAFLRLAALLRRLRPAVMHSRNWATFDAIPAARIARVPVVVHGEHGRDISDPDGRNARRNRIRRLSSPLVDRFVAVSDDLRRWLLEEVGVPAQKVIRIHNGVDLNRFGAVGRADGRERVGMPADAVVVGTVGRLDPVKDQASLVHAFAPIAAAHAEVRLMVVGDGPCRGELDDLVRRLSLRDRVSLLGERSDVPELLAAMDVFVLPSIAEGISNTILEAMGHGLPVVATAVGGNPELVEDGTTGRLVPRQDVGALTAAIEAYVDDVHLRRLHGKASRQRAAEHFGLERMANGYIALYQALLGARRDREA
jgi:sugar transferase (PEP-CTERM/EpsH1 system associated)